METSNDLMEDIQDSQYSQQQTQSTQPVSQVTDEDFSCIWGYLEPCSREVSRISFFLDKFSYNLGRRQEANDCILTGRIVSGKHCVITWDGTYQSASVTVLDKSSNGTYINGKKIGRNNTAVLRHGSEISFGPPLTQPSGPQDYRFTYRHAANPPITTLDTKYDILMEIGKGSYGVVKKAVCRSSGEYVAVKILNGTKTIRSPGNQNSHPRNHYFYREVEVLQKLKHQNICALKEAFFHDDYEISLVLEFVEGGDLLKYLLPRVPLGEVEAQHITYQICDALSYIHSKNVAHRDLKPENILLTEKRPPIVKVADFGMAKFVDSQTLFKTMCGSPAYLAPEIVKQENAEGYDNLVDSWSVGVMVFTMLTGLNPFIEDGRQRDIRTRILERTIDWKSLANENPAHEATEFIRFLLEVDPRRRMTLTNALEHLWLKEYTPVYGSKTNSGSDIISNDNILAVQGNEIYPRHNVNLHIRCSLASNNSVLPVDAADNDSGMGLSPKTLNDHVAPTPLPGDASMDCDYGTSGSDEYPPGLLKSGKKQIVADGVENEGIDMTTGTNPRRSPRLTRG